MYGALPGTVYEKHFLLCRLWFERYFSFVFNLLTSPRKSNRFIKFIFGLPLGALTALLFHFTITANLGVPPKSRYMLGIVFGFSITLGFAISSQMRCLSFLVIPSIFGRQGRTFVEAYAITLLLTGPLANTIYNARETSRAMTCSNMLAYNITADRVRLRTAPLRYVGKGLKTQSMKMEAIMYDVYKNYKPVLDEVDISKLTAEFKKETDEIDQNDESSSRAERVQDRRVENEKDGEYTARLRENADIRCTDVMNKGIEACRYAFEKKEEQCKKNTNIMAPMVCWPYKITVLCKLVKLVPTLLNKDCNSDRIIPEEFNKAFMTARKAAEALRDSIRANVHWKMMFTEDIIDIRSPEEMVKDIKYNFEKQQWLVETVMSLFRKMVAFLFILMIWSAFKYHKKYLDDIAYDNRYVTMYFRWIDFRREVQGKRNIMPLRKLERKEVIETSSFKLLPDERSKFISLTAILSVRVMAFTLLMFVDKVLSTALDIINANALINYQHKGVHYVDIQVNGTGAIAVMVRGLLLALNWKHQFNRDLTNRPCLPVPRHTPMSQFVTVWLIMFAVWVIAFFQAYAMRTRHVIAAFFYPKRAKKRTLYLYNNMCKKRRLFLHSCRKKIERKVRTYTLEIKIGVMSALVRTCPLLCKPLKKLGIGKNFCLICGDKEKWDYTYCPNPHCPFGYCAECWKDVDARCYACREDDDWSSEFESSDNNVKPA